MICTFQGKLIAFFLLAMTLLEADSETELNSKAGHYLNKPYDEVLGAAQLIKLEIHLIV